MLSACHQEEVDRTPVWFMRQAGRFLPDYRHIRSKYSLIEICKTPSVCETVTVMPVKELGVDAAIIFSDIMLPLESLGVRFNIEENVGPVIENPIRSSKDFDSWATFDAEEQLPFVSQSIKRVKEHLEPTKHALIGFSGAPFTLASYLVEGRSSRDFALTKQMMYSDKGSWESMMEKLADMVSDYLALQIRAGADIVQLFDSWAGALSISDYVEYVSPYTAKILKRIKTDHPDTPTIHFGTNTYHLLEKMYHIAETDVFSIDWRVPISDARKVLGNISIQGNLEPAVLLSADLDFVASRTQRVIDDNQGEKGHIFNLGHGILRETPVETARFVVDYVHKNT